MPHEGQFRLEEDVAGAQCGIKCITRTRRRVARGERRHEERHLVELEHPADPFDVVPTPEAVLFFRICVRER